MNNNFGNQSNWSYNNYQNRPNFNSNRPNYGPSQSNWSNHNNENRGFNYNNRGFRPNFNHPSSNMSRFNTYNNQNKSGFSANHRNYNMNTNHNWNNSEGQYNQNHCNDNQPNNRHDSRDNFNSRNNFNSHRSNNYRDYPPDSKVNSNTFEKLAPAKLPIENKQETNCSWEKNIKSESSYESNHYNTEVKMESKSDSSTCDVKKEFGYDEDIKRKVQETVSKSRVKSVNVKVKTENTDVQVKSEPVEVSGDEHSKCEDVKPSRPVRASKRTKIVKPLTVDSEDDSDTEQEIVKKPVGRTRKRKIESSDDEYAPEDQTTSVVKKSTRSTKSVKNVSKKVKAEVGVSDGDALQLSSKEKPVRKPRVTKKVQVQDTASTNANENLGTNKSTTKTTKRPVKRKVKTENEAQLSDGDDMNTALEEKKAPKLKVATKRKLKASTEAGEEDQNNEVSAKKTRKIVPNETYWRDEELLAEMCSCEKYVAWNFIKLINSDNTIPFIARYRKEMVQNYEAEKLREMKQAYENIVEIHQKAENIISKIEKLKKMTPELKKSIYCCKSLEELDLIYSPYKVGSKGTKAEKAKKLGLEEPALAVLNGDYDGNLERYVDASKAELSNAMKVKEGIQHIIADIIAKDTGVLETLQGLLKSTRVQFESTKTKQAETIENFDKYETYFSYSCDIKFVKPHAVLAINRGESHKVLSVNVKLNDWLQNKLFDFCKKKWCSFGVASASRSHIFHESFDDSFKRLIKPFIVRSIRSQLNQTAEIASIQVFASNLKQLLLVPPMHGAVLMAIDPGYSHGCKVAVIDTNGNVLVTDTLYIKFNKNKDTHSNSSGKDINALKLRDMILRHSCELVAIGNGTACRETETYMSELIQSQWFEPLNVCYTIISEQGASIYSCSAEAKKEFPDLDPNVVSAISLARRLQDPLSELVKIEPKHMGVGMYQHDVPEKQLTATLNEVVSECVSFVGVDINCASQPMLRRLAGLTDATAANIIKHRTENGAFQCREDLKKVKGIGEKRFEQCAGFVRISYTEQTKGKHNPLDSTWVHPEAYDTARKFARNAGVNLSDLGKERFVSSIKAYIGSRTVDSWAEEYATSPTTVGLIIEAFLLPRDFDLRSKLSKPLFKQGIQSLDDISTGTLLTGKVTNVTHFGCFVDTGLEREGLIHSSKMNGVPIKLNDKVNVRVIDVDKGRKRVALELIEVLV
uniref:S1 RNA-binding domain-containing protein 1 n=1 Tax=Cacopsylla melanoneura TaxID=428564 RepID=A0A8D9E489_9HEMI